MAITPRELFNERIPAGLRNNPEKNRENPLLLQFNVSGPEGGSWTVDTLSDPPTCNPGVRSDAQCTINISDKALTELASSDPSLRGPLVMKLIVEGTIDIEGDMTQAMKLGRVFSAGDALPVSPEGV
jgi:hypothetical protein